MRHTQAPLPGEAEAIKQAVDASFKPVMETVSRLEDIHRRLSELAGVRR